MPGCMAGAMRTLLSVLSLSDHICARFLCCPCLFLSSVLSSLPFIFCVFFLMVDIFKFNVLLILNVVFCLLSLTVCLWLLMWSLLLVFPSFVVVHNMFAGFRRCVIFVCAMEFVYGWQILIKVRRHKHFIIQ